MVKGEIMPPIKIKCDLCSIETEDFIHAWDETYYCRECDLIVKEEAVRAEVIAKSILLKDIGRLKENVLNLKRKFLEYSKRKNPE